MQNRITVKNLAMSSSNLTFMLKVLPKLPERLPAHITFTDEFEKLKEDIENHITEVFNTVTNIIRDMIGKSAT